VHMSNRVEKTKNKIVAQSIVYFLLAFLCVIPCQAEKDKVDGVLVLYEFKTEGLPFTVINLFKVEKDQSRLTYAEGIKYFSRRNDQNELEPSITKHVKKYADPFKSVMIGQNIADPFLIKKLQKDIEIEVDGNWGPGTWLGLVKHVRSSSGRTLVTIVDKRYCLIDLALMSLKQEEMYQLKEGVVNGTAEYRKIPIAVVQRIYDINFPPENQFSKSIENGTKFLTSNEGSPNDSYGTTASLTPIDTELTSEGHESETELQKTSSNTPIESASKRSTWRERRWVKIVLLLSGLALLSILVYYVWVYWNGRRQSSYYQNYRVKNKYSAPDNSTNVEFIINQIANQITNSVINELRSVSRQLRNEFDKTTVAFDGIINRIDALDRDVQKCLNLQESIHEVIYNLGGSLNSIKTQMRNIDEQTKENRNSIFDALYFTGSKEGDSNPISVEIHRLISNQNNMINKIIKNIEIGNFKDIKRSEDVVISADRVHDDENDKKQRKRSKDKSFGKSLEDKLNDLY
jgi:uncharacterized protein YoxC